VDGQMNGDGMHEVKWKSKKLNGKVNTK